MTRKVAPEEVSDLFKGKDRRRNTRYVHTLMSNPDTPEENKELVGQYVVDHPEEFLTDDEIRADPSVLRPRPGRGYRQPGRGYLPDGRSVNLYNGETYDRYGNPEDGFHDGGEDFEYRPREYEGIDYGRPLSRKQFNQLRQGMGLPPVRTKNDPAQPISPANVNRMMYGLRSNYARTRYVQKVLSNPQSNAQTVNNLMVFRAQHPNMFVDDATASEMARQRSFQRGGYQRPQGQYGGYPASRDMGSRPVARDYDRESWNAYWMTKEEYDSLPQTKKSLFTRFFMSKDRNRNSKLALKILADPGSSQEEAAAVREIVNERPRLFFKKAGRKN